MQQRLKTNGIGVNKDCVGVMFRGCTELTAGCCTSMNEVTQYEIRDRKPHNNEQYIFKFPRVPLHVHRTPLSSPSAQMFPYREKPDVEVEGGAIVRPAFTADCCTNRIKDLR